MSRAPTRRSRLASLRKMIKAGDLDTIDQALEILTTLADPTLFDALLDGAVYEIARGARWLRSPWRQLNNRKISGSTRPYVVLGLLAAAPPSSAAASALREQVEELFVTPLHSSWPDLPLDLLHLEALPNLERLMLWRCGPIRARDRSPRLPALEWLEIRTPPHKTPPTWIAGCEALRALSLVGGGVPGGGDLPAGLRSIGLLNTDVQDLSGFSGLQELRELRVSVSWPMRRLGDLRDLPALETLRLTCSSTLRSLEGLAPLPALREVELLGCRDLDASALARPARAGAGALQRGQRRPERPRRPRCDARARPVRGLIAQAASRSRRSAPSQNRASDSRPAPQNSSA